MLEQKYLITRNFAYGKTFSWIWLEMVILTLINKNIFKPKYNDNPRDSMSLCY